MIRRGLTLIEIVVTMAIMGLITAVAIPSLNGIFDLQQRAGAQELARTYTFLVDEAVLRNVTFRVAYNLDRGTWKVEIGDANTLIFGDAEAREAHESDLEDQMSRFTQREIDEGAATDLAAAAGRFEGLETEMFTTGQELPGGTRFGFVYTPQYGEGGVEPQDTVPEDPEDDRIAYSYIFPDGTAEHTVVRIVADGEDDDGYTLEVEPISGKVRLATDLVDPADSFGWLPDAGPDLP
jgi:prepilin-type N-terminal cleavage/methylation domain-containing protein